MSKHWSELYKSITTNNLILKCNNTHKDIIVILELLMNSVSESSHFWEKKEKKKIPFEAWNNF